MGKKGSWFSAIKRFCTTSSSKQKPVNEAEKRSLKEKKGLKHGFIPRNLFREPSSIEKILGEVDQHNLFIAHPHPHPILVPHQSEEEEAEAAQPSVSESPSPPRAPPSPRVVAPQQTEIHYTPEEPTVQHRHLSATKIQAVYRGYMARRKLRGLTTGLVRLQGVIRGQHVKRQTVNAMKQMQLLVRLQTQIQSQRMQTIENQALKRQQQTQTQTQTSSVANNQLEMGDEDWDHSSITKEEREARLHRKKEALNKRERAMAYAYSHSHQLWKGTPKSAQNTLMGYPWWWNWLDRELPTSNKNHHLTKQSSISQKQEATNTTTESPQSSRQKQAAVDSPIRPSSSRSMAPSRTRTRQLSTTPPSRMMKFSKPTSPYPMKDDDSLMSCPPFSVPHYMSPTVSAKAKARPTSNPKDRVPGTPGSVSSQRRFSFPVTPNSRGSGKSVGDLSVDSAFSIGRKPFNRFV